MTKITTNSRSTTYDWLLNILKNSLTLASGKIALWRSKRGYAIARREAERQRTITESYDKSEFDGWCERININDKFEVNTELVRRLLFAVESNPYPGKQARVQQVAVEQVPDASKSAWADILTDREFGFPVNFGNERIYFPNKIEATIEELEQLLHEQVREDRTILASEVTKVIGLANCSARYKVVKQELQTRGWCWRQRREQGKVVSIVVAPP